MNTFCKLLDNALAEISRREPTYASRFPINLFNADRIARTYRQHPLLSGFPVEAIERALAEGIDYLTRSWPRAELSIPGDDPLILFFFDNIVDSFCSHQGLLTLMPYETSNESISEVLVNEYTQRRAPNGTNYYVRNRGRYPLLLINATGIPISIWRNFLTDSMHEFKIIIPHRRGSDLFRGGLNENVDIRADAADLESVLVSESVEKVAVVAWCNGARVGIHLANSRADQISALILLGPMLKGVRGVSPRPTVFDRDLQPLLDAVRRESAVAPVLSAAISERSRPPDWERWRNAPRSRVRALFALPAKDQTCGILVPLSDSESLVNIARRVKSDEEYPMHSALAELRTRTMVIMGSDDQVVSNDLASSAIRRLCASRVVCIILNGGGHYIQDLQYHYFRFLLTEFIHSDRKPPATARIRVEELTAPRSQTAPGAM